MIKTSLFIALSAKSMNGFESILGGKKYKVFMFSTFTGLTHPFTPQNPIDLENAYALERRTFYQAWYSDERDRLDVKQIKTSVRRPKLYILEKFWKKSRNFREIQSRKDTPGRFYHSVAKKGDTVIVGAEIFGEETVLLNLFYTYKVSVNGAVTESHLVEKGLMDKYTYVYRPNGRLADVKIEVLDIPGDL